MQYANFKEWDTPQWEKVYPLSKIRKFGKVKGKSNLLCDLEGNFNLMCSSPRALRLLSFIVNKRNGATR